MSKDATINLDHKFMVTKMEIRKNPSFLHNKKPFISGKCNNNLNVLLLNDEV